MKLHPHNLDEAMYILRQKCRLHSPSDINEVTGVSRSCIHHLSTYKTRILRLDTFVKLCNYFEIEVTMQIINEHIRAA